MSDSSFTVAGSHQLEQKAHEMISEITSQFKKQFFPEELYTLLLIGGYGKGEGGVHKENGQEKFHNNFDFLLITHQHESQSQPLKKKLDHLLLPITSRYQIGFDTSVVSYQKLLQSPTLLIWYEMFHGHKMIVGDASLVPTLPFADLESIPAEQIFHLMVNRGSLLIINDWILSHNPKPSLLLSKVVIKHVMKAVIGFGDALLYFLGDYHWSYRMRQKRIMEHAKIPETFRKLYNEASSFRFETNYSTYLSLPLKNWMIDLTTTLAPIFLRCESIRLNTPDLSWEKWLTLAIQDSFSRNGWKQKIRGLIHFPHHLLGKKLAFACLNPYQRLALTFPFVAFNIGNDRDRKQIEKYLKVQNGDLPLAYLVQWSQWGDINFKRSITEWGVSLEYPCESP